MLAFVSKRYSEPKGRFPRVTHPCATKAEAFVRLACVRHAASVRSEPGSNSQVQIGLQRTGNRLRRIVRKRPNPSVRKPVTVNLLQLWMPNRRPLMCRSQNQIKTQRQTVQSAPPPAHPFSQHGMHLSKIPPRSKQTPRSNPPKRTEPHWPVCLAPRRFHLARRAPFGPRRRCSRREALYRRMTKSTQLLFSGVTNFFREAAQKAALGSSSSCQVRPSRSIRAMACDGPQVPEM